MRMKLGFRLVGSGLLALLAVGGVLYCVSSDPHSTKGFLVVLMYFCIQASIMSFAMPFDEDAEASIGNYLAHGINKTAAMVALIAFASPHPQFTGALLWLGVSFLFLSSGAKDLGHVCFFVVQEVKTYRSNKAQVKARIQAEIAITNSLKVEEMKIAQDNQMEDDLLSDLSDFLSGADSNKA